MSGAEEGLPPAPEVATPAEQQVRLKCLELTVEHFREARINARYLSPGDLVDRAAVLEAYVREGKK